MADVRIKNLSENTELADNQYLVTDNGGTRKTKLSTLAEWVLSTYNTTVLGVSQTIKNAIASLKETTDGLETDISDLQAEVEEELDVLQEKYLSSFATDTASGSIASFPDGADNVPVKNLKVSLSSTQDLHGYSKPWAGGTGKNFLESNVTTSTVASITLTNNEDGSITINGTLTSNQIIIPNFALSASSLSDQNDEKKHLPNGTYTVSTGNDSNNIRLQVYGTNTSGVDELTALFFAKSGNFTIDDTYKYNYIRLWLAEGTYTNATIYPMIRLATESDTTYEPYENICPMYPVVGKKNLLPVTQTSKTVTTNGVTFILNDDGTVLVNGTATALATYYVSENIQDYFPPGDYILTSDVLGTSGSTYKLECRFKDVNNRDIYPKDYQNGGRFRIEDTLTIGSAYIQVYSGQTVNNILFKPMIRRADVTSSSYAPYDMISAGGITRTGDSEQTKYDVYWEDSIGVVYNGTVDTATGELVVDRVSIELDGSDDETWGISGGGAYRAMHTPTIKPKRPANNSVVVPELKSSYLVAASDSDTYNGRKIGVSLSPGLDMIGVCLSGATTTVEEVRAYLNAKPLQVVYPIATPITYQLTPMEVTTLLGNNNIWSDVGDVEVTYRADTAKYIEKKLAEQ